MNESDALPNTTTSGTIERRTVLKVAAWATPAITLMSATPAFAATPVPVKVSVASATGVRSNMNVTFTLTVANPNNVPVTITGVSFTTPPTGWTSIGPVTSITPAAFPAASTNNHIVFGAVEGNSSAAFPTFSFTLLDERGETFNLTVALSGSTGNVTVSQS